MGERERTRREGTDAEVGAAPGGCWEGPLRAFLPSAIRAVVCFALSFADMRRSLWLCEVAAPPPVSPEERQCERGRAVSAVGLQSQRWKEIGVRGDSVQARAQRVHCMQA